MVQSKARLISNSRIKGEYFRCVLEAQRIAASAYPGQFINIKISGSTDVLLRRPFSIHRINVGGIELLYEVVGKGTKALSQKKPNEFLDVIGPLGSGFNIQPTKEFLQSQIILVAGGIGVAPLTFLAEKLMEIKNKKSKIKIRVLIGAKTKNRVACADEFEKLGCGVKIATDDGSAGFKGKVTDLLRSQLSILNPQPATVYACGPRPMLKAISALSRKYNMRAQLSLEEHMACGIGACLGCVVKTKEGMKRVCKEGPVFDAREIIWEDSSI